MRQPPLEMISAVAVAVVLVGTMVYSVVSHEDHDHAASRSGPAYHETGSSPAGPGNGR